MLKYTIPILFLVIGIVAGQKLTTYSYDPVNLENNVLSHIGIIYATGCSEGIRRATGQTDTYLPCLDLAEKTVRAQESILRNQMWDK